MLRPYFLLFCILVSSCSSPLKKLGARRPSSISEKCTDFVSSYLRRNSESSNDLYSRTERTKEMRRSYGEFANNLGLVEKRREKVAKRGPENISEGIRILKKSHDNGDSPKRKLKGRDSRRDKIISYWNMKNNNTYAPSYYKGRKGNVYETIIAIADGKIGKGRDHNNEDLAIANVEKWITEYKDYWKKLEEEELKVMKSAVIVNDLKKRFPDIEDEKFLEIVKDNIEIQLSVDDLGHDLSTVVPIARVLDNKNDGEYYNLTFDNSIDLRNFYFEHVRISNAGLADGLIQNYFRKSQHYQIMLRQAELFRIFELIVKRITRTEMRNKSKNQVAILKKLNEIMNDPELRPRSDAVETFQKIEMWAERLAKLNFFMAKVNQGDIEIDSSYYRGSTPIDFIKRYILYSTLVVSGAWITSNFSDIMDENDYIRYHKNYIINILSELFQELNLLSEYRDCGDSLNNKAIVPYVNSQTSRHQALARIDDNYDNFSPDILKKQISLAHECVLLQYETGEAISNNMILLSTDSLVYKSVVNTLFARVIENEYGGDRDLMEIVRSYLDHTVHSVYYGARDELLDEIRNRDDSLADQLQDYQNKLDKAENLLKKHKFHHNELGDVDKFLEDMIIGIDEQKLEKALLEK